MTKLEKSFESISTLTELIKWRALHTPELIAFNVDGKSFSYSWLYKSIRNFASLLIQEGLNEKDRVVLLVPNSAAFFVAFYGSLFCRAIAVPVFPNAGTERSSQILKLCGGRHLILPVNTSENRKIEFKSWAEKDGIKIHWVDEFVQVDALAEFPDPLADDIAFIQYTSGSTDFPKGVPLTHNNLLTNVKQMVEAMNITSADTFVSWLPVYHDMGLILNTMVPFYLGGGLVLLEEGLHKVHSWLKAIEQYKGTFISAPDIAYRLCVKSIRRPDDYDLSSLRVALNASERVQLQTYSMFEETFHLKNVMVAGYGLAEATVAVTMHPPGEPPVSDNDGYVASGKALDGIKIKIDDRDIEPGEKKIGEILVKSIGLMKGYFNNNKNIDPFTADGYLRTGDIGYMDIHGNLYILARKKNCIKHAGHTIYPDDVEQVVKLVEGVRQVAAIGIEKPNGNNESLYVFAEFRSQPGYSVDKYHSVAIEIVQKIYSHLGVKPGRVFIVKPKTVPRTPNGKMQHSVLKEMFVNNYKQFSENVLYPKLA